MTPAQTDALNKAWKRKQRREGGRFAMICAVLTGKRINDFMAGEEEEDCG